MNIYDAHVHIENGLEKYKIQSVKQNVIFNTVESYFLNRESVGLGNAISLIFDFRDRYASVCEEVELGHVQALKIHSRIQRISKQNQGILLEKLLKLNPALPIIYDAFYYGAELEHQPSLTFLITLIKKFPHIPFVIAHCGGHKVLDYFYHLRTFNNVYFDISFSLVYLKGTSAFEDLIHLIRYTDCKKILFGTDYPHVNPQEQLDTAIHIFDKLDFSSYQREQVLFENANNLFSCETVGTL